MNYDSDSYGVIHFAKNSVLHAKSSICNWDTTSFILF